MERKTNTSIIMELERLEEIKTGLPDLHSAPIGLDELRSKEEVWLEKRKGKFTASEYDRLIAGVDETEHEAAIRVSKALKDYLVKDAEELNLSTAGTKVDIAHRLVKAGYVAYGAYAFSDGGETYVLEKVIEELTDTLPDHFETSAMRWGKEWEEIAVKEFMRKTGIKVDHYGDDQVFVDHESEYLNKSITQSLIPHIGCTPDGLIGDDAGIETKCRDSKQHFLCLQEIKDAETLKATYPKAYWQCQGSMYLTGRSMWFFVSFDPRFKQDKLKILIVKVKRNDEDIEKLERRLKIAVTKKIEQVSIYNQ
jgi:hypothetical protein